MSIKEVYTLIGKPLSIIHVEKPEVWIYDNNNFHKGLLTAKLFIKSKANCIYFNNNKVINATGNKMSHIKIGMTKKDVIQLVNEPNDIIPSHSMVLHYSAPSGKGLYRARIILVNNNNIVVRITTYNMYD